MSSSTKSLSPVVDYEDGDVPPLSARETFSTVEGEIAWPTFKMQTAQDDLKVRASMREETRDAVTKELAKKASRLKQRYAEKIEKVELFKKYREDLRNKVRDLNVKHAEQRSKLREQIVRVRAQGSIVSRASKSESISSCDGGGHFDTLSALRQSISSVLGIKFSGNLSSSSSSSRRAQTAAVHASRRRQNKYKNQNNLNEKKNIKKNHVPDGSSFYEFSSAPEAFDSSTGSVVISSNENATTSNNNRNQFNFISSNSNSTNIRNAAGGSSLTPSMLPLSTMTRTTIDAETGEEIELNLTASVPAIPMGMFSKSTGEAMNIQQHNEHNRSSHLQRKSWNSVPRQKNAGSIDNVFQNGGMINNGSLISNTSSGFVQSSGLNYYDGGSSVLPSHTLSPYSQSQKIGGRGGLGESSLRARTAYPHRGRSGFLTGPNARRMMARRARHVNLGCLAPRDMTFPQPTTFWEKEWAKHSNQQATHSSVHLSDPLRHAGMKHMEDMRLRQMNDMQRLIEEEKSREIERQAREMAAANDPIRRKRLFKLSTEDRERSRKKILRIAREHELALASRMASLGILR
jgi:hypothetical protein